MYIRLIVDKQSVTAKHPPIFSGSVGVLKVKLEWRNFDESLIKLLRFKTENSNWYTSEIVDNVAIVPHEVIQSEGFYIALAGYDFAEDDGALERFLPTNSVFIAVGDNGFGSFDDPVSEEVDPETYIAKIEREKNEAIQSIKDKADKSTTYTKTEVDEKLDSKSEKALLVTITSGRGKYPSSHTFSEIKEAIDNGSAVFLKYNDEVSHLYYLSEDRIVFKNIWVIVDDEHLDTCHDLWVITSEDPENFRCDFYTSEGYTRKYLDKQFTAISSIFSNVNNSLNIKVDKEDGYGLASLSTKAAHANLGVILADGTQANIKLYDKDKIDSSFYTNTEVDAISETLKSDIEAEFNKSLDSKVGKEDGYGLASLSTEAEHANLGVILTDGAQANIKLYDKDKIDNSFYTNTEVDAIIKSLFPQNTAEGQVLQISGQINDMNAANYQIYGNSAQYSTPSPEHYAEIQSVGDLVTDRESEYFGKYEVKVKTTGKNLINTEEIRRIDYINNNGNSSYKNGCLIAVPPGTYSYSANSLGATDTYIYLAVLKKENLTSTSNPLYIVTNTQKYKGSINIQEDDMILVYEATGAGIDKAKASFIECGIQLEIGSAATSYEPYTEYGSASVYLNEPLRKLGNIADYIDFENQTVVRNISRMIFDGTENWFTNSAKPEWFHRTVPNTIMGNNFPYRSTRLSCSTGRYGDLTYEGLSSDNIPAPYLYLRLNGISTIADLKAKLAEWAREGTPLEAIFISNTPTTEHISIPRLNTGCDGCNIITYTTTTPSNILVSYFLDTLKKIQALEELVNAQAYNIDGTGSTV